MRKIIIGLLLALWIAPAFAQAPPAVPALPDTERRTSYSITATTCNCNVNFALYGDSTDVANWIQVWVNGVQMAQAGNWNLTSPTGSLATIPRPITDAVLNFTVVQTGTIQIVGARRPRRLSQFPENRGVAARDLNQAVTDLVAENREQWDALLRSLSVPPGDTAASLVLPSVAARASKFLGFDATGVPAVFTPGIGSGGNVVGSGSSVNGNVVCYNGTSGLAVLDCGLSVPIPIAKGGTSQITAPLARGSAGLNIDQYTPRGDAIYTILATDRTVGTNAAFTAPRVWTLPAANAVNPGQTIDVADYFGGVTGTNTLTIQRAGSDTISISPTSATSVVINVAFGRFQFRSDGVSKWSAASSGGSGSLPWRSPLDYGALCDGSTNDFTALQAWLTAVSGNTYIGYIPPGKTCTYSGTLLVSSNTTLQLYGATLKARNSAANNTTLLIGVADFISVGPSNVAIYGGTFDANKVNQSGVQTIPLWVISATNVTLVDGTYLNGAGTGGDCLYIGGTNGSGGQSVRVKVDRFRISTCQRNGISLVGSIYTTITNGFISGAITAPGHGIDVEPDNIATRNDYLNIDNVQVTSNGGWGISVNPAAIAGSVTYSSATNVVGVSNTAGDFSQYSTPSTKAGFRFINARGTSGTPFGGSTPAVDALP